MEASISGETVPEVDTEDHKVSQSNRVPFLVHVGSSVLNLVRSRAAHPWRCSFKTSYLRRRALTLNDQCLVQAHSRQLDLRDPSTLPSRRRIDHSPGACVPEIQKVSPISPTPTGIGRVAFELNPEIEWTSAVQRLEHYLHEHKCN